MEYDEKMYYSRETMPQTVPSGIYSPDTYAVYADNFDLSLLSMDDDNSLRLQSQLFLESPTDFLPSTLFNDIQTIKIEKQNWIESTSDVNSTTAVTTTVAQTSQQESNLQSVEQQQNYQNFYATSSLPSPPHQTFDQPFLTIFPPSPTPSIELSSIPPNQQPLTLNFQIKQEYIGLFPPSPPDSNCAPSPRACDIKSEPDTEDTTEASIDIDSLLQNSFEAFEPIRTNSCSRSNSGSSNCGSSDTKPGQHQDHQVLREYLLDTSFQRRHNLKPLALESLLGGWGSRGDIEPVISLALEHAKRDVQQTCAKLNISSDPQQWTPAQVQSWLQSTISQFKLSVNQNLARLFPEDGAALSRLTDEDFTNRIPQAGSILHAQLEVWKAACSDTQMTSCFSDASSSGVGQIPWSPDDCASAEATDDEDEEMSHATAGPSPYPSTSAQSPMPTTSKPARQGGSHIHLWQFLKELLASPQLHGTSIRWLDRTKGVFKIEDSVRVARLWGRRKNRPAMNYDKLSRSIRQYYKKGIMKKTERSQRLVYQFCHPYCL